MPNRSTGRYVTSKPRRSSCSHEWSTAWCSMPDVTTWLPAPNCAYAAPLMAALSDSVPPLVKTIAPTRAPRTPATVSRASSRAFWDSWASA